MSSCERCWKDAGGDPFVYTDLLKERKCTPEEQAGEYAGECPWCDRKTLHQHTGEPMCGCPRSPREGIIGHSQSDAGEKQK
jgi:hypothetical protein